MSEPAFVFTCENCGKRVLPSDTLCWHCGYKLPQRTAAVDLTLPSRASKDAAPAATPAPAAAASTSAPSAPYDLCALGIYGALTLFLILALLLVMRALGQQPLLVNSAGLSLGDDWIQLTDSGLRYTLGVPGGWQWLDVPFRDQQSVLADLIERQPYIARALNPLGAVAGDVNIQGVAIGSQALELPDPAPFAVIATSARLRDLDPQGALDMLASSPLPAVDRREDTSVPLQPRARFSVLDAPANYQCLELFTTDRETAAYLVAACAPQDQFATNQRDLNAILDSFQLLER